MIEYFDLPTIQEIKLYVTDQLKNNDFFAAAGFFSLLGAFWLYFKKVPLYLWTRIKRKITYEVNIYETDEFYIYFEKWLSQHKNNSYRSTEIFLHKTYDDRGSVEKEELYYRQFSDIFYFRRGLTWLSIWKGREKLGNANNKDNAYLNHFKIKGLFAKRSIEKWMLEIINWNIKENDKNKNSYTFINDTYGSWIRVKKVPEKSIDSVFIENKNLLIKDIDNFLESKDWYNKRSISYKRGYYLYGEPGTGKSSLICALANKYKKDVYYLNIDGLRSDSDLIEKFKNIQNNSILVIEDIDAIFNNKREKEQDKIKISFSGILNCLDGIFSKEGLLVFFTTNHPERIDPALVRQGRMDYHFKVSYPQKQQIEEYINIFYEQEDLKIDLLTNNINTSMVKIQEICIKNKDNPYLAIKRIQENLLKTNGVSKSAILT